ncbi:MAG: nucleotidyltransferase [Eubacteriales bacterium]|nr:nucleotidyltransferase [Eubacteriales bacterium]
MRVLGIVTEYNPFHNGHLHHLSQSISECSADAAVCVMSGNFVQRGEPAIVNKWARSKMAIEAGIDLIIELPVFYAMSSAEHFAFGAIKILDSLGIVDVLSFGSESGDIGQLQTIADILYEEPAQYKTFLKSSLSSGISFPLAREKALERYLSSSNVTGSNLSACLSLSNNILGIEYLKALRRISSKIMPVTISRIGGEYNSCSLGGSTPSASAIRKVIMSENNSPSKLDSYVPEFALRILDEELAAGRGPVMPESFGSILLSMLRGMTAADIAAYPDVTEGLENRIIEAAGRSGTFDELVDMIATKRYPVTRIQRILFSIILGMTKAMQDSFDANGGPMYIRVLAFNDKGRKLLADIKCKASLPIIVKTADHKKADNGLLRDMIMFEAHATDIYVLGYNNPQYRNGGQEFTVNLF